MTIHVLAGYPITMRANYPMQLKQGRHCGFHLFLISAIDNMAYRMWGVIMAMSLVHGGPGPRCLSNQTFLRLTNPQFRGEMRIADISAQQKIVRNINQLKLHMWCSIIYLFTTVCTLPQQCRP